MIAPPGIFDSRIGQTLSYPAVQLLGSTSVLALRDLDRDKLFGELEQRCRITLLCGSYAADDIHEWFENESAFYLNPPEMFQAYVEEWNKTARYPIRFDSLGEMLLEPFLKDE